MCTWCRSPLPQPGFVSLLTGGGGGGGAGGGPAGGAGGAGGGGGGGGVGFGAGGGGGGFELPPGGGFGCGFGRGWLDPVDPVDRERCDDEEAGSVRMKTTDCEPLACAEA